MPVQALLEQIQVGTCEENVVERLEFDVAELELRGDGLQRGAELLHDLVDVRTLIENPCKQRRLSREVVLVAAKQDVQRLPSPHVGAVIEEPVRDGRLAGPCPCSSEPK